MPNEIADALIYFGIEPTPDAFAFITKINSWHRAQTLMGRDVEYLRVLCGDPATTETRRRIFGD